jgi:methionyl-tRNA formyltransferase
MTKLNIFISGQKYFGASVFRLCKNLGHNVAGVCVPLDDNYLRPLAITWGVPVINAGMLSAETMPANIDLGIAAHSFDYVGRLTRAKTNIGWLGYHPSLLPRHRGKSSIEWAIRMRDPVTGGSVFWLDGGIDRGDIAAQEFRFIDPVLFSGDSKKAAARLWKDELLPLGITLLEKTLRDISAGIYNRVPQDPKFSTFEPGLDHKDIFKPDLLKLN